VGQCYSHVKMHSIWQVYWSNFKRTNLRVNMGCCILKDVLTLKQFSEMCKVFIVIIERVRQEFKNFSWKWKFLFLEVAACCTLCSTHLKGFSGNWLQRKTFQTFDSSKNVRFSQKQIFKMFFIQKCEILSIATTPCYSSKRKKQNFN
jgi:hypothetical protein